MTMASVTLTLTDTPDGRVAVHSSFKPHVGKGCTPAQSTALEILARTRKDWGVEPQSWERTTAETPERLCAALLDPEDLGHSSTPELRDRARRAIGLPATETAKATT